MPLKLFCLNEKRELEIITSTSLLSLNSDGNDEAN